MQDQKIIGRREGAVGHVVFNNPAKLQEMTVCAWSLILRQRPNDKLVSLWNTSSSSGMPACSSSV